MEKKEKFYLIGLSILVAIDTIILAILGINRIFDKTSWDWGSFVGGIFGGAMTLAAVLISINNTKGIQKAENDKSTFKNLLIVYYDLRFAHESINEFLNNSNDDTKKPNENSLSNLYLDQQWLHTIPQVSSVVSSENLRRIYNIYGNISDLIELVKNKNNSGDIDSQLVYDILKNSDKNSKNELELVDEIKAIISVLEVLLSSKYNYCVNNNS